MATLLLKNINKIYPNKVQAVFDFNLEIKDKEFIVFVGPSGCGKSTTLRMIAGLEDITSGEFYIDGKLMNIVEPKDRNIAMVFQSYALYPHMTVYGNMEFALKLRKVRKPVYQPSEEVEQIKEENKEIFKQIKEIDKQFKKKQNNSELLEPRKELYDKLYENEKKIESLSVPVVGIDEEMIKINEKAIKKLKKDNDKAYKLIAIYEANPDAVENLQALKDYCVVRDAQIKELEEKNEYLKTNEVEIYKLRHLTSYERNLEINKVAESIDLVRYLYRKPSALSGGQRQRVALGRAIVRKPKVFLMDEPLSNLDAKLRVQTRSEIAKIHQNVGATTIYVTHDQTEALTLADRIVIMKDGYIQQIGSPKEVYEDPANKFVGGFIGSPAMNFIVGKVSDGVFEASDKDSSLSIKLDKNSKILLKDYEGKEVIMGIRPEDTYLATSKIDSLSNKIDLDVDFTELLGKEHVVYGIVAGQKLVMKTMEDIDVESGDKFSVKIDLNKIYFFNKETENRIK